MPESATSARTIALWVDECLVTVPAGSTVSAALLNAAVPCRISVSGERRTAMCGMGICFECRAEIDGVPHRRTCQLPCRDGMRVRTDR